MLFEDVMVGRHIPDLVKGPLTPAHLMRWSAAIENWHRIHYDWRYATEHDGLPDVLVSGSWKQHMLLQLLRRWTGSGGWTWRLDIQFRGMNVAGETLTAWGKVTATEHAGEFGLAYLDVGIRNQAGAEGTSGTACVALPLRAGPGTPYPFAPAGMSVAAG